MRHKHKEQSRKSNNLSNYMKKNRSRNLKTPKSKASPSTVKTATHTPSTRNNRSNLANDSQRESSRRRPKTSGLSAKQPNILFSQRQPQERNNSQHGSLQARVGRRNDSRSRRVKITPSEAASGGSSRARRGYDQRKLLKVGALFNRDEFNALEIQNVLNNWRVLQCLFVSLQTDNLRQVEPSLHTFFVNVFLKQYNVFLRGFTRYNKIRKKIFAFMVLEFWVFFLLFYLRYQKGSRSAPLDALFQQVLGHLTKNTFYVGLILLKAANFNVLNLEVGYLQNFINRSQSFNFPTGVPLIKTLRSNNDAAFEKLNQVLLSCPRALQKLFKRTFVGDFADYSAFLAAVRAPLMMELPSSAQYIFKTMDESFFYGEYPFGVGSPILESFRTPQLPRVFFSLCLDSELNGYSPPRLKQSQKISTPKPKDKRPKSKLSTKSKASRNSRSKLSSKYALGNPSSRRSPRNPKGYKLAANGHRRSKEARVSGNTSRSRKERGKTNRPAVSQPKKMEHSVSKSLAKTFKMSVQGPTRAGQARVKKPKTSKGADSRLKKRLARNEAHLDRLKNNYGAKRDRGGGMSKTGGEGSVRNASKGSSRQLSRGVGSKNRISGYSKHSSLARSKKTESPLISKLTKETTQKKSKRRTRARDVEMTLDNEEREENEMSNNHLRLLEKKAKRMQLNQTPGRKKPELPPRSSHKPEKSVNKSRNNEQPEPIKAPVQPQKKRGKSPRTGSKSRGKFKVKTKTIVASESYAQNIGFGRQVNSPPLNTEKLQTPSKTKSKTTPNVKKNKKRNQNSKAKEAKEAKTEKTADLPRVSPEQDLRTNETLDALEPEQVKTPKSKDIAEVSKQKQEQIPKRPKPRANLTHTPNPKRMPYNASLKPNRKAQTPNPKQLLRRERETLIAEELTGRDYCLVLDLDETLIHFKNDNGRAKFLIRPYTYNFLRNLSEYYELIIFTAAQKEYADWILDKIDSKNLISYRFYRNHCLMSRVCHLKDISLLNRDLAKTLIVDNFQENFSLQKDNGIHIKGWYGDTNDTVLETLEALLLEMARSKTPDIRNYFKDVFQSRNFSGLSLFT